MYKISKKLNIPEEVKKILKILNSNGTNKGYLVGGAVRDILLGIAPKDFDFCSDFENYSKLKAFLLSTGEIERIKEMGKHFGVLQIQLKNSLMKYEVALLRKDVGIPQNRKEQIVEFVKDLEVDLMRRDFTMNAIAYDGENIYSLFNLNDEIKLEFIGDYKERIKEDPLRILRYVRFLVTKPVEPVKIEKLDENWIMSLLETLSKERIKDEFNKIIMSNDQEKMRKYKDIFLNCSKIPFMRAIIPFWYELNDYTEHAIEALCNVKSDKLEVRLAILFYNIKSLRNRGIICDSVEVQKDMDKSLKLIKNVLTNLKYSKDIIDKVIQLIRYQISAFDTISENKVEKLIKNIGLESVKDLLTLMEADILTYESSKCEEGIKKITLMKEFYYKVKNKEILKI